MRIPSRSKQNLFGICLLLLFLVPGRAGADLSGLGSQAAAPKTLKEAVRSAPAAKFTVLGVYTALRFKRGEFNGYMPILGEDFFARERTSLRNILTRFFAFAVKNEGIYRVTDPIRFDLLSDTIYKEVYNPYDPTPGPNRFNMEAVKKYSRQIGARYLLLGDVTKLDIKDEKDQRTFDAEVAFYLYDRATATVTFQQTFSATGSGSKMPPDAAEAEDPTGRAAVTAFASNDLGAVFVKIGDQLVEALKKWQSGEENPAAKPEEEAKPAGGQ